MYRPKILSPIKLVAFKIQDAKIYQSNRLTVLFTMIPISTLFNERNRVKYFFKETAIFNIRALQIDLNPMKRVQEFL